MAYRKKTIRRLPPTTRQIAHLIDAIGSTQRILKNLLPKIERLERDSQALANHACHTTDPNPNQPITFP